MNNSVTELLERMRVSREALAQQLVQLPNRNTSAQLMQKTLSSKRLGITIGVALAAAALTSVRRHHWVRATGAAKPRH